MEKAFKLDFVNDKTGSLYVNCCGCSQTAPLHSFGPASKPHYLIHYVLSGKGHFRFHDKEYRLEAGYGFLIQPNELAFYQADAKDPWSYLWVGFAGSRAEEYLHSMGLSDRHPIFSCDKSEELYSIVRDMMEHNTFGIADDLRRNGLLGVFLSVIADSAGVVARSKGYGSSRIPDEGTLDDYLKSIGESTARRHTEIYLINCDDVTQAEEKLLRNHDSDEKKRVDRVIYYKEMGVAHQQVGDKHYYMIILMR